MKIGVILSFIFFIVLLAPLFWSEYKTNRGDSDAELREYQARSYELASFVTPNVTIDGVDHVFAGGLVRDASGNQVSTSTALAYLRTADYAIRTRLDPIMALPEVDINEFESIIGHLSRYTDKLEPYFTETEMELIHETFYPTPFLKTLPALESARRELAANPSPGKVQEYDKKLAESLAAYHTFTERVHQKLPLIAQAASEREDEVDRKKDADLSYTFLGGESSIRHFRNVVAELNRSILHLSKKRESRLSCFNGSVADCPSLDRVLTAGTQIELTGDSMLAEEIPDELPPRVSETHELLSVVFKQRPQFQEKLSNLQALMLTQNTCTGNHRVGYYTTWYADPWMSETENDTTLVAYRPLEDIHFYELTRGIEEGSTEYFNNAQESGLSYDHQSVGNHYMCPDNAAVATRLVTLASVRTILSEKPIFRTATDTEAALPALGALARMEREIVERDVLPEPLIANYLQKVREILLALDERGFADRFGENKLRTAERLLLLNRTQSAHLEGHIATLHDMNNGLPSLIEKGASILIDYLYISRSNYMLLLLGFNRTVAETPISFFVNSDAPTLDEYGLHTYHNDLKDTYSKGEIVNFILRSDRFYLR